MAIISLHDISQLVFVMQIDSVLCEVRPEFLKVILTNFRIQNVRDARRISRLDEAVPILRRRKEVQAWQCHAPAAASSVNSCHCSMKNLSSFVRGGEKMEKSRSLEANCRRDGHPPTSIQDTGTLTSSSKVNILSQINPILTFIPESMPSPATFFMLSIMFSFISYFMAPSLAQN